MVRFLNGPPSHLTIRPFKKPDTFVGFSDVDLKTRPQNSVWILNGQVFGADIQMVTVQCNFVKALNAHHESQFIFYFRLRDEIARVLFCHYEVLSILMAPSHLVRIFANIRGSFQSLYVEYNEFKISYVQ